MHANKLLSPFDYSYITWVGFYHTARSVHHYLHRYQCFSSTCCGSHCTCFGSKVSLCRWWIYRATWGDVSLTPESNFFWAINPINLFKLMKQHLFSLFQLQSFVARHPISDCLHIWPQPFSLCIRMEYKWSRFACEQSVWIWSYGCRGNGDPSSTLE